MAAIDKLLTQKHFPYSASCTFNGFYVFHYHPEVTRVLVVDCRVRLLGRAQVASTGNYLCRISQLCWFMTGGNKRARQHTVRYQWRVTQALEKSNGRRTIQNQKRRVEFV